MAELERISTEVRDGEEKQDISLKTEPQPKPELDETLERLTKQVAKGGGIAFGGSIIGKVASFGLHILLGRVLGPGSYGLYALGTSVTGIAQSVGSLGLKQGVVRFCAMYRGEGDNARVKGTILSALTISSISSVVAAAILFAFSGSIAQNFFHEPDLIWVLRVFALALPFYVLMGITTSFAQSFRRIDYQQGVQNIFRPLVSLGLVGLAFIMGFGLVGAVWGFLISGIVSAGLGFYLLWKLFPSVVPTSGAVYQVAQLLKFSVPMFLIGISFFLLTYTDKIMLGVFRKASDVGIYNAANVLAMNTVIFIGAINNILLPIMSELYNHRKYETISSLYRITTRWILIFSLPLFLVFILFPNIMLSIFGAEYSEGSTVLILLALAYFVGAATGPGGVLLRMSGRQNIDLINAIVLVIGNITLNLWLIPAYGVIGAALATSITYIVTHITRLIEVFIIFKIMPYNLYILKPTIAGIIAVATGALLNVVLVQEPPYIIYIRLLIVPFVFAALLWILGLHPQDVTLLSAIVSKFRHAIGKGG